jgi:hypothetical protein
MVLPILNCSEFCDERGRLDAEYWSWFVLQYG